MFSWLYSAEPNQEEKQKRIALEQCEAKMKTFGILTFGERHHEWIRHLSIEWYFSDAGILCFICRGPTVQYPIIPFEPNVWTEDVMGNKERLEDHLATIFLCYQRMDPSYTIGIFKHEFATRHRLALYLDYKFNKAMNKKE